MSMTRLSEFEARVADDEVKSDLELVHVPCGTHVCDIEHEDTIEVLVNVANNHTCPHPDTIAHEESEEA